MNWRWQPTACALVEMAFDALPAWLDARNATLWFVGDSLNADMGEQLSCYLKHSVPPDQVRKRIRVVRMDRLGASPKDHEKPWGEMGIAPSDIVVLNAGAHWYHACNPEATYCPVIVVIGWNSPCVPSQSICRIALYKRVCFTNASIENTPSRTCSILFNRPRCMPPLCRYGDVKNSQAAFKNVSKALLRDVNPRAVVFRTTVMGHHRCETFV